MTFSFLMPIERYNVHKELMIIQRNVFTLGLLEVYSTSL
jgi:hypothetical protein